MRGDAEEKPPTDRPSHHRRCGTGERRMDTQGRRPSEPLRDPARTKGRASKVLGSSPASDRVQGPRDACPDPVRHRHDADRRCPLSAGVGGVCAGDAGAASEPVCRARSADPTRDLVEPGLRRDLRRARRDRRLGLAESRVDADLCRCPCLAALVSAGVGAALSLCARHLVLLDASLDAPPGRVQGRACRPPCQPPADRLGRDGVSSDRGGDRRCGNSATRLSDSDSHRRARLGPDDHDRYGRDQPYGMGNLSSFHVAGAPGGVAHHRQPPPTAS